jgi:hypothetical protein
VEKEKNKLEEAFVDLTGVKPKNISTILTTMGDNVAVKFMNKTPTEDQMEKMQSLSLPRDLRKKINNEGILPNQKRKLKFFVENYILSTQFVNLFLIPTLKCFEFVDKFGQF